VTEVWVFNHYAVPPDVGAGTRHYDLAMRAAEHGISTTIFAASFDHASRTDRLRGLELVRRERHGAVTFVWLRSIPYRGNGAARIAGMIGYAAVAIVAQARRRRPDVVIGSSVHPIAALAGFAVARLRGARFFYEIRDLWPQTLVDMGALDATSPLARWLWWLEGLLVRRSEAVIYLLPGVSDYLRERGLRSEHAAYLPNAVPSTFEAAGRLPRRLRRQLGHWRDEGSFVAIYAGAHGRANALGTLIDAATRLKASGSRVRIAMVGDGPHKPALESAALRRGLDNVAFFDPVPKQSVQALLALGDGAIFHLADIEVFRYGISSNKLFDYLLSGLPIVFACNTSNDPVADVDAGFSIAPEDPEALADALDRLAATNEGERRQMGENGRRYVRLHHGMEAVGDRFAELILGPR
jgi:glycosyltransferase involved in cell wall biosynthesis